MPHFGEMRNRAFFGFWRTQINNSTRFYYNLNHNPPFGLETDAQHPIWRGRFTELKVIIDSNTMNAATWFTLRVNGAATALRIEVAGAWNGLKSVHAVVPVAEDDLVCLEVDALTPGVGLLNFRPALQFH